MRGYTIYFQNRYIGIRDELPGNQEQKYALFDKFHGSGQLSAELDAFLNDESVPSLILVCPDTEWIWQEFRRFFIPLEAAGGVVKNSRGEILLIKRRGVWDLPKGKIHTDESLENAAIREVREECGIKSLEILSPLAITYHTYPCKQGIALKRTHWFTMRMAGNESPAPQREEGISELRWFSPSGLDEAISETYRSVAEVIEKSIQP